MKTIDKRAWTRRDHFNFFSAFDQPHFGLCANVDITAFYPAVKQASCSMTVAIVYLITRAANAIPEFRQRIREDSVVEHEVINPGFTILVDQDTFSFCIVDYMASFTEFSLRADQAIARVKDDPWVHTPVTDDLYYMTAIPWVSFTSMMHPMHYSPVDSVPRFAWGKFFKSSDRLMMPLGVQGHHALIDGIHAGRFYDAVQCLLDKPDALLS